MFRAQTFLNPTGAVSSLCVDRTPTHKTHLCSAVCSQARTAQLMRLAQELHCDLCAPKQVLSSGVTHVSSMVVLSCSSKSTSSSSPTYPATQQEHAVHPAHLNAPSVDVNPRHNSHTLRIVTAVLGRVAMPPLLALRTSNTPWFCGYRRCATFINGTNMVQDLGKSAKFDQEMWTGKKISRTWTSVKEVE